ncbi:MAG: hypothetical protein M9952_02700 [Microthrixaceae bacterium]|nr:hypothetical protein [Microthrixaceae bacterium]
MDYLNLRGHADALAADVQVVGSTVLYGDPAFDTVLGRLAGKLSAVVGVPLLPTYSFVRVYRAGQQLVPHTDRSACEHSVTVHLGSSSQASWPISVTTLDGLTHAVPLAPGDGLGYRGSAVRHWRDVCRHEWYAQLFLHYVEANGQHRSQVFDGRDYLGLPREAEA